MIPPASGESINDFVITSPEPVIQLVQVEQLPLPSNNIRFTFRNTSNKTVLEICVSAPREPREMDCMNGFISNGVKLPEPGDTFSMNFDGRGFSSDGQQNSLHVNAVIYTDGSHVGEQELLADLENQMFGMALETKRISSILSSCPDDGIAGFDDVLSKIGVGRPSTSAEAAHGLDGVSLTGIPPSEIELHLALHAQGLLDGVVNARDYVHHEIDQEKAVAASPFEEGTHHQQIVLKARSHGLSDLAEQYRLRSQSQTSYLISFLEDRKSN